MLRSLLDLYQIIVFVAVILSWVNVPHDNPIVRVIRQLTEPVFEAVRKVLPAMGGFDFSPIVVLIGLRFLRGAL